VEAAGAFAHEGEVADWLTRRHGHIAAGRSSLRLGHVDFFAHPARRG